MINNQLNKSSPLKILLWNANGLLKHKNELQTVLIDLKIDIALLTETHFTEKSHFNIFNYTLYKTNHPDGTAHAGSCILISNSIQHNVLIPFQEPSIQATNISIKINNIPITVSSVYCPPCHIIHRENFFRFFNTLGHSFIAGGDFNAKHSLWGCLSNNQRGKTLHSILNNGHLSFASPPGPTYWPSHSNRNPDILDFFITNIPNHLNIDVNNISHISSDHTPVILSIGGSPKLNDRPSLTKGPIAWDKFQTNLDNLIDLKISLKTQDEIENAAQNLVKTIKNAAVSSTKTISSNFPPNNILPYNLRLLISKKRRARSTWQNSRLPSDKQLYNRLSNFLKKELFKYKADQYLNYIKSLNPTDNSLWKATKKLTKVRESIPPLLKRDNMLASTDEEKSLVFAEHLISTFKPHQDIFPNLDHLNQVSASISFPLPMSLPIKPISPGEIVCVIKKLPANKAPGHDLITNKVLKHLSKKCVLSLTHIFNSMLRLSYFPSIWKLAVVILIPKVGKPKNLASSYRPISLLPTLGKLFEKLILLRIRPILYEHQIIPNTQFGFRTKHSTIHQVHRLTDTIANALERKQYCTGLFLDIAQAFDRVWHDGLLYKLKKFMPAQLFLILKSFLSNRKFTVRQGNSFSPQHNIAAGVPQGSDLAPDLFNIYTSDIPRTPNTVLASFADDTALLSTHNDITTAAKNLQYHASLIEVWCKNWLIKINESKSTQVTFSLRRDICPLIKLNNITIPVFNETKYLGIILDKRLTWGPHLRNKRKIANIRLHLFRPLLKSKLKLKIKILLYKTIIRPLWSYGIQIWGPAKPSNIRPIQSFQNITLRIITGAPWYLTNQALHNDLKIKTANELAKLHYKRFHTKLPLSTNPLIQTMSSNRIPDDPPRRLKRNWNRDLLL